MHKFPACQISTPAPHQTTSCNHSDNNHRHYWHRICRENARISARRRVTVGPHTEETMKQIEAVINQLKLQEVRDALEEIGISDFMESAILCHQKGQTMIFRGASFMTDIVEKVKLEIITADDSVAKIIETIGLITRTEKKDDCRISIRPYLEVA